MFKFEKESGVPSNIYRKAGEKRRIVESWRLFTRRGSRKNKQGGPRIDGLHFFIFVNTRVGRTKVVFARDINTIVNLKVLSDMLSASGLSAHAQIL
jgi:hypothetical protein